MLWIKNDGRPVDQALRADSVMLHAEAQARRQNYLLNHATPSERLAAIRQSKQRLAARETARLRRASGELWWKNQFRGIR